MKIACPKCGREYRLDPSRIPAKGARFTCWGCQAKVEVRPLQAGQSEAAVTESPSSKDLKEHKPTVDEAKIASSPPSTPSQTDSKSEEESFFTGPGIKKSSLNQADSEPKREPSSAAKTAPLLPSKLQTPPNPSPEAGLTGALVGSGLTGTLKAQPLKITCPKCQHVYRIDPSRIPSGGGKFTCRNCQARIEVRPNQKAEEKTAESTQKGTSRYQTPPVSQPTMPNAGLVTNVADAKASTDEELNKPGPITGPFSFKPPKEEEPKVETQPQTFDGESTMVMGSPPSQIKKAIEESQAKTTEDTSKKDFGFSFSDPTNEVKEPVKAPGFDFADLNKPKEMGFDLATPPKKEEEKGANFNFLDPNTEKSSEEPKANFNFVDDATPLAVEANHKEAEALTYREPSNSDTKRDLTNPLEPRAEVNSTLAMTNADIASAIESRTKEKEKAEKQPEKKLIIPTPPVFEFDLNLPDTKPSNKVSSGLSQASEDMNATAAVETKPSWQSTNVEEKSQEGKDDIFNLKTVVGTPSLEKPSKEVNEADSNKTKELSSVSTFKVEEKEQPSTFAFVPPPVPPRLEKPGADLFKEPTKAEEKLPIPSPISLAKGEEEKKAEPKLPPPPSLKPKAEAATIKEEKPVAEIPTVKPPKVDLPKPEPVKKEPKSDPPKAKADILNKPIREEKKTEELPVPVYNPDIFSPPPPIEEPESGKSGLFKGLLLGSSVALLGIIIYFAFFRTPAPITTSSPTPTQTQIVKNSPTPVNTPDEPVTSPTPKTSASPTPTNASPTPKATTTPTPTSASPTPKATVTPTPKATDKPSTGGSLPDSLAGGGKYTVQVRATQSQSEAESIGKKLRSSGAEAYVVRADLGAKGIWYRVRVGRYQSFAEAQKAGTELKSKGTVAEFIATTY